MNCMALTVRPDLRDLKPEVLAAAVEHLLGCARPESEATFRCAALPEMRAELLACYTREALEHGASGPLRQSGALTSFNLPNRPVHHEAWRLRDAPLRRGELLYKLLRDERQVLEMYARKNGCDLIIDPSVPMGPYRPRARRLRLATLLEFLRDDSVANLSNCRARRSCPAISQLWETGSLRNPSPHAPAKAIFKPFSLGMLPVSWRHFVGSTKNCSRRWTTWACPRTLPGRLPSTQSSESWQGSRHEIEAPIAIYEIRPASRSPAAHAIVGYSTMGTRRFTWHLPCFALFVANRPSRG